MIADPKILILDEATANIDSFTALEIQKALKVLLKNRASIVIGHEVGAFTGAMQARSARKSTQVSSHSIERPASRAISM